MGSVSTMAGQPRNILLAGKILVTEIPAAYGDIEIGRAYRRGMMARRIADGVRDLRQLYQLREFFRSTKLHGSAEA